MKTKIILFAMVCFLSACGNSEVQDENHNDTATKVQESAQGSHTPDNEPENRNRIDSSGDYHQGTDNNKTERQ